MNIRKTLAALALMAATLTSTLGATTLTGSASADYATYPVTAYKDSIIGYSWGSEWHLRTYAELHKGSGYFRVTTQSWTTGMAGFHGCVRVTYYDASNRALGSLFQMAGTTGIFGQVRTVPSYMYIDPYVAQQVHRLGIEHWHCPQ